MLLDRNEMKFGACEFSMFTFAKLASENFILIYQWFVSVTEKAIMKIVHLRFFQGINQIFEFHEVKNGIFWRSDLVDWPLFWYKLQTKKKRLFPLFNFDSIDSHIVEFAVSPFCGISNLSFPKNKQIVLIILSTKIRLPKKVKSWKILRLLSFKYYFFRLIGSLPMNEFSYSILNFLRILTLSSM
jgi:hypothetical protein